MKIILLRHVESQKNITRSFSSDNNSETITDVGESQAECISKCIYDYINTNHLCAEYVYCASSNRAFSTANILAKHLQIKVHTTDAFLSVTTDDNLKGKTENEVQEINPQFIYELELYRCGLFNAYEYTSVADVIKTGEYERQVLNEFYDIIQRGTETLKIFIMHYSSLTATLINVARIMGHYPKDFYGKVEFDLGKIYLLDYSPENHIFNIELANSKPDNLYNC